MTRTTKLEYGLLTIALLLTAVAVGGLFANNPRPLPHETTIAKNNLGMEHWPSGAHIELKAPDQVPEQ